MRTCYFYSQVFALLTSTSIAANAAPAAKPEPTKAPVAMKASANAQSGTAGLRPMCRLCSVSQAILGETKALAIVVYRESNGLFVSFDELFEVKGIGKALPDNNREKSRLN
ncbi:Competence protein ComEA-like protein with helix-hairpin-helix repeat region [Pseudomonas sp. IT-P258]|uniref:ComEA family DNA-binding protein n=1 Tax=Pseudomonas sp. IT-P258 TaxID=3026447 RepID=UPI0039E1B57C